MSAAIRDITIEQGATFTEVYTYPANLTGYTSRSQIRDKNDAKVADFVMAISSGISTSTITRSLSATATSAIPDTSRGLAHDLELVSPDGTVVRLVKGKVTLDPEVTK